MRCLQCGRDVEENKRFCTNCGGNLENDDAVMRIIEEVPIVNRNQGIRMQMSEPLTIKLKRNRKKVMAAFTAIAVVAVILLAANLVKKINTKEYKYSGDFVLMTKVEEGKSDLYIGVPGREETKLASDVSDSSYVFFYIITGKNSRKIVYHGKDGNLYEVDDKGEKEQIAENVRDGYIMPSLDLKSYTFIASSEGTLYVKKSGREKVEIDKDVTSCFFLGDNETLLYSKRNNDIYIREKNGKSTKVAENGAAPFYQFSTKEGLIYMKEGNGLYYKNLRSGEERRLTDEVPNLYSGYESPLDGFQPQNSIVYRDKENLYYLKFGEDEPVKVAEGVTESRDLGELVVYKDTKREWHCMKLGSTKSYSLPEVKEPSLMEYIDGYLFYVDNGSTLYRTKLGSEKSEKIQELVTFLYPTEKELYFTVGEAERKLYKVKGYGKASMVQENTIGTAQVVDKSYLAYISGEQDLYVDGKKYIDVQRFAVSGKNICYVNADNELYMIKGKSAPVKICNNINDYTTFYYGGWLMIFNQQLKYELPKGIQ